MGKIRAPRGLTAIGKRYWRRYIDSIDQSSVNLMRLEDLCFWEERKESAWGELRKRKSDIVTYKDKSGKLKHTQPHAAIVNLRTAQDKINALCVKLFKEAKGQKPQKKSRVRSMKDYTGLKIAK